MSMFDDDELAPVARAEMCTLVNDRDPRTILIVAVVAVQMWRSLPRIS